MVDSIPLYYGALRPVQSLRFLALSTQSMIGHLGSSGFLSAFASAFASIWTVRLDTTARDAKRPSLGTLGSRKRSDELRVG
eukprot:scaffold633124_cov63-Attheya_sp.AAC.2